MNSKKIQETFRKPSALPEDFSWDKMEDGIQEKMAAKPQPKKIFWTPFRFMGCMTLVAIAAMVIYFYLDTDSKSINEEFITASTTDSKPSSDKIFYNTPDSNHSSLSDTNVNPETDDNALNTTSLNNNNNAHLSNDAKLSHSANLSNQQPGQSSAPSNQMALNKTNQATKKSLSASSYTIAQHSIKVKESSSKNGNTVSDKAYDISSNENAINNDQKKLKEPSQNPDHKLKPLASDHPNAYSSEDNQTAYKIAEKSMTSNVSNTDAATTESSIQESLDLSIVDNQRTIFNVEKLPLLIPHMVYIYTLENNIEPIAKPIIQTDKYAHSSTLSFYGGINGAALGYGSDAVSQYRSKYEKDTMGYQWGIAWQKKLNPHWAIETGLQYNVHNSILDYKSEGQRYEQFKSNAILGITINTVTNDTTVIIGQGIEKGVKTRIVRKLNRYHNLTLPIMMQRQWHFGKWEAALGAGPYIMYSLSYSGKSAAAQDSFVIEDNQFVKTWQAGLIGHARIGYQWSDRISVGLMATGSMPFQSMTQATTISVRRYNYGLNAYVAYQF